MPSPRDKAKRFSAGNPREQQLRLRIAEEAARILAHDNAQNFRAAKQKAAERLGIHDLRSLPSNEEVESALIAYQRLFGGDRQAQILRELREAAVAAMAFFQKFSPRLVGAVLSGTATEHAEIQLHLFTDQAEEVEWYLMEHKIPFEPIVRRLVTKGEAYTSLPGLRFLADDVPIEVIIFPLSGLREAPRATPAGEPIKRAPLQSVQALLVDDNPL